VRLYSRPGNDLTWRFPLIVETLARLRSRSCIIDGETVVCDDAGMSSFNRIRYRRHDATVFLYAFDLIQLNGDDLRRDPLEREHVSFDSEYCSPVTDALPVVSRAGRAGHVGGLRGAASSRRALRASLARLRASLARSRAAAFLALHTARFAATTGPHSACSSSKYRCQSASVRALMIKCCSLTMPEFRSSSSSS
jgi:ATP dependent DNA ligase domain